MNFQLYNDKVWTFPLKSQNALGVSTALPGTANPAAVSSNPASLGAAIIATGPPTGGITGYSLVLTPKVQASPGLTATVSNVGMAPVIFAVDIVADPNLLSVMVDTVGDTTTAQNIPTAPGP